MFKLRSSSSNWPHQLSKKSLSIMPLKTYSTKADLYKYQDDLPSLPVPSLSKTLARYKKSIIPFYPQGSNDPEFLRYSKVIDDFAVTKGPELQEKLVNFSADKRNWLSEFWDNYAYLDFRDPVSPFVSYFYGHKDINTAIGKDQLLKASCLTYQALKFMESVQKETLEPELIKGNPFCMESFKWMFNNCRVPGESRDSNNVYNPVEHRYMIVIANNKFYKLYHHDANDNLLPLSEIYANLVAIHTNATQSEAPKNPVGILTSSNRDVWFESHSELIKNPINVSSLTAIEASSFVLCLDSNSPQTIESKSRNAWHGNGTNRWFDKPIQIMVSKNGSSGFLAEHSKMDGTPTLRMNDWICGEIAKMTLADFTPPHEQPPIDAGFEELKFEVTPKIQSSVVAAVAEFEKVTNSMTLDTFQYFGLGKNQIKQFKTSPDAFIQMLIQLAYYKYTGTVRATYEAASTRKYFKGRTETCRSVSAESLAFVRTWEDTSKSNAEKIVAFRNACASHVDYINAASNGEGVDRHLFGLSQMEPGEKHEFFSNPMFSYSSKWYISTSQLSSERFNCYGWSPVVPEGFGLAYMMNKDWMHINITVFKDNQMGLKGDELKYYLGVAANELKEVLGSEVPIKAKL